MKSRQMVRRISEHDFDSRCLYVVSHAFKVDDDDDGFIIMIKSVSTDAANAS